MTTPTNCPRCGSARVGMYGFACGRWNHPEGWTDAPLCRERVKNQELAARVEELERAIVRARGFEPFKCRDVLSTVEIDETKYEVGKT